MLVLTCIAASYADDEATQQQQLWSRFASALGDSETPRAFDREYFLPGHQFEPNDPAQRAKAEEYAHLLIRLAREQLPTNPTWAYQLLHEAAYYGRDNLADKVVQHKSKSLQTRRATRSHPRLKWKRGDYFRITSEHYQVVSRDEQTGREIAKRLETLYAVWRQLFFECWSDHRSLQKALDRKKLLAPRTSRLHRVVLFANQQAYTQFLQKAQPRIGITRGFYDIASRTSYFFDSQPPNVDTQLHEVTHQLFQELMRASERLRHEQNFWALEATAMYMESLRDRGHFVSLGGLAAQRLQFARYRRLQEDFHVPIQELVTYGRQQFQTDPRIRKLYSQSAGLAHLLMDGQDAKYRRGFVRYLKSIYAGRDAVDTLSATVGTGLANLDAEYLEFLSVNDRRLAQDIRSNDDLRSLCLGNTAVTNSGLKRLPPQPYLEWLDLAQLTVDRSGLDFIRDTKTLQQVSFDRCGAIGDEVLEMIAQNPHLDELDLTATGITDAGLQHLQGHAKLQTLWVGHTNLTDASIRILSSLPSLARIECSGTGISAAGLSKLRQAKPNLVVE